MGNFLCGALSTCIQIKPRTQHHELLHQRNPILGWIRAQEVLGTFLIGEESLYPHFLLTLVIHSEESSGNWPHFPNRESAQNLLWGDPNAPSELWGSNTWPVKCES